MKHLEICLQSHGRRPVCPGRLPGLADVQAQVPAGWCVRCGAEVYRLGESRCGRCRQGTERSIYEVCESL